MINNKFRINDKKEFNPDFQTTSTMLCSCSLIADFISISLKEEILQEDDDMHE